MLGDEWGADTERRRSLRYGVVSCVRGSKIATWVELRGLEPLTPSMRTRCATRLRHSPKARTG